MIMFIKNIKNSIKQITNKYLVSLITKTNILMPLTIVDTVNMKVKIGNVWYGASNTYSTNPASVSPFTKIIYLEHANFSGYYDPNRDFNTKTGLNYYHYKQTDPNDYSLQTIFVNNTKITDNDKVCFILSPGTWKAQSPRLVSSEYTKYGGASLRSNGFYMWNVDSCLIGFGCSKTTIEMDCNTSSDPYDASCLCLPTTNGTTGYYIRHTYAYLSFTFTTTESHHNYFATSVGVARNGYSTWNMSDYNVLRLHDCILNFNSQASANDVYANGGTFEFLRTKLNFYKSFKNRFYFNRDTTFKNLLTNYVYTISVTLNLDSSRIFSNLSSDPQITDITPYL